MSQHYLDTKINKGWGRNLHAANIYMTLCCSDEPNRAVSRAMVSTGTKEIEEFATKLANQMDEAIAKFDRLQEESVGRDY